MMYAANPQPAISISGLSKTYKSRGVSVQAVNDLSLRVDEGQVFGLLGANGAGKTTTIKMICSLVKPTSGTIKVNGFDVQKQHSQAMKQIGAVLEGTRNVYWRLTAWQNVLYFGRLKGVYGRALRQRAERLLTQLDVWQRRDDKVRTFSRGMQQKVAIACALIADPPIVLLDEPTLGLDVKAALTVKQWIETLSQEYKKTIVLTTHHLAMAQQLCDHVAIINKGVVVTNQPTSELLGLFRKSFYEIKIKGHLQDHPVSITNGLTVQQDGENTVLSGAIDTQEQLYKVLDDLRGLNLPLLSVMPVEPNLEEVFINTIDA